MSEEPNKEANRARIVREALDAAGLAAFGDGDFAAAQGFMNLARCATDRSLAHLGRLLK